MIWRNEVSDPGYVLPQDLVPTDVRLIVGVEGHHVQFREHHPFDSFSEM